ncbi:MAG: hypothetical protein ABSH56_09175 [Bryobacteraceae bacterium]
MLWPHTAAADDVFRVLVCQFNVNGEIWCLILGICHAEGIARLKLRSATMRPGAR